MVNSAKKIQPWRRNHPGHYGRGRAEDLTRTPSNAAYIDGLFYSVIVGQRHFSAHLPLE